VKHANWQFFEIQKKSSFGHNFLNGKMSASGNFSKSENFSHPSFFQQYWQFFKIQKIASLVNLSKLETCPHEKIVPNLTNFPIDPFFQQYALTS
jgi:hypothetical protein